MDELDERILHQLEDGKIRYMGISKSVGVPVSTVHSRVKRLEREKVIRKYTADIDWRKAGLNVSAYILIDIDVDELKRLGKTQDKMLKELLGIMYVKEGSIITGEHDLIIKVAAKDTLHLREILLDYIGNVKGIKKTNTMVILG
jgi:DNA-binding Lrp family transcriptional regulator